MSPRVIVGQGALDFEGACSWERLRKHIREAVDFIGPKEAAYALDVSPSRLNHAIEERERNKVPAEWLVHLNRVAPTDDIADFFARGRGLETVPATPPDPDEHLKALLAELAASGEVGNGIAQRAVKRMRKK